MLTKEQEEFLAERLLGWKPGEQCSGQANYYEAIGGRGYCDTCCSYLSRDQATQHPHDVLCPDVLAPENMVKMIMAARRCLEITPIWTHGTWEVQLIAGEGRAAATLPEAVALALYDALKEEK